MRSDLLWISLILTSRPRVALPLQSVIRPRLRNSRSSSTTTCIREVLREHHRSYRYSSQSTWTISLSLSSVDTDKDLSSKASSSYQVSIEFCTGCRWGLRAFWMAQELLTTFEDAEALQAVTLIPSSTSGRFLVQCYQYAAHDAARSAQDSVSPRTAQLLWDRAIQDGFPEMKVLKQLVRDQIDPSRFLGHSDTTEKVDLLQSTAVDSTTSERSAVACDECAAAAPTDSACCNYGIARRCDCTNKTTINLRRSDL
jgi:selenoprotein W-related protein